MAVTLQNKSSPSPSAFRSGWSQWLLPGTIAGMVVAHCVMVSHAHLFWADELLTWYPVTAPFRTMLLSTADTINAAPPLYFILTWVWAHVFGGSELALRLFSALALGVAIAIMFSVLRRVYGMLAAALAVGVALAFCDQALLAQSTFARFHTLIMAEVALAIFLYQRLMACRGIAPLRLVAANFAVHAAIVMTHYFGPLFSGAILAGVLLTSVISRFNPVRAAASIVLGWAVFLPWIPVCLRHRDMARPSFWIEVPNVTTLRQYYEHYFHNDYWVVIASGLGVFLLAGLVLMLGGGGRARQWLLLLFAVRRRERSLLMLVPGLGAVPLIAYYVSTRPGGASFFSERYLHSVALGWAILCAHLCHRVLVAGALSRRLRLRQAWAVAQAVGVAVAVCWGSWGLYLQGLNAGPKPAYEDLLLENFHYDKIVVEHIHEYLVRNFYSSWPQRYQFVVDEEVGIQEGGGGVANHRIMAGLKRQFPAAFTGVFPNHEFLALTPNFWVKRNPSTLWWSLRIAADPRFVSEPAEQEMIHVTRRTPAP